MSVFSFFFFSLMDSTANLIEGQGMDFTKELLHMLVTLLLVLGLIFVTIMFLKKFMASRGRHLNKTTAIKILEKRSLHQKASLYLVEVENKKILISDSTSGVSLICHLPYKDEEIKEGSSRWKTLFSSKEPTA